MRPHLSTQSSDPKAAVLGKPVGLVDPCLES